MLLVGAFLGHILCIGFSVSNRQPLHTCVCISSLHRSGLNHNSVPQFIMRLPIQYVVTKRYEDQGVTNADREIFMFPVQLTTRSIGNLTRLIHILAICCCCLKKNQNAPIDLLSIPQSGGKMSKRLGGIIGCKYKTSSWHLNGFPYYYGSNIGSTV